MKKLLVLILAAGMIVSCSACNETSGNSNIESEISVSEKSEDAVPE